MIASQPTSNLLVGAGGWAYFRVQGRESLRAYASSFDFVEVNSTYYEYPDMRKVSGWRSRVPRKFEFSVRCNKEIVQALRRVRSDALDDIMGKMEEICRTLDANILTILVPRGAGVGEKKLASGLGHVISTFRAGKTRIAVETRGGASKEVLRAMEDNDAIHCVDISNEQPAYESGILYSRIFGKGQDNIYQFDDDEVKDIARSASAPRFEKSILAFHGVRMFGDAARLKSFLQTGKFLQVTGQTGLDSLGQVLKEDTSFPTSKRELVARQGWKLFDLTVERRVRAGVPLSKLAEKTYASARDVMASLEPWFSQEAQSSQPPRGKTQSDSRPGKNSYASR